MMLAKNVLLSIAGVVAVLAGALLIGHVLGYGAEQVLYIVSGVVLLLAGIMLLKSLS